MARHNTPMIVLLGPDDESILNILIEVANDENEPTDRRRRAQKIIATLVEKRLLTRQRFDNAGDPLDGGFIITYQDQALTTAQANPIVLLSDSK